MNTLKKTTLLLTFIFGSYISFSQQIGNGIETQITNFNTPLLSGAYQADGSSGTITGGLQSLDPSQLWNHLFNIRHSNTAFNYQLQIASTYAENDRLFFRKIGQAGTPTTATWFEIATRKENTFVGNQYILGGNVGIGTSTPVSKLTIWDNNNTSDESQMIRLGISSIYDYRIFRQRADGILRFDGTQNTYSGFKFSTPQAPNGLIILNAGNVGIGTTVPRERLEVNGNARLGTEGFNDAVVDPNTVLTIYQNGSASGKKGLKFKTWDNVLPLISIENSNFPNKSPFTVNGDGKTKIGLNMPLANTLGANALLSVDGKIACKELVVVDPTKWADFVFDKNYQLMPLHDVEIFYNTNKHLPSVPSEKEVKTNGINTAEMEAILLQKIEELTLYIVQQQKEINELKKEIKK